MIARNVFDIPAPHRRYRQKRMTRRICVGLPVCHAPAPAVMSPLANDSMREYRYCFMKIPPGGRCGSLIAAHITFHE
jgi:hypothetical protein